MTRGELFILANTHGSEYEISAWFGKLGTCLPKVLLGHVLDVVAIFEAGEERGVWIVVVSGGIWWSM